MSGISAIERDELFNENVTLRNRYGQKEEKNAMLYYINETYHGLMMEGAYWQWDEAVDGEEEVTETPTTLSEV